MDGSSDVPKKVLVKGVAHDSEVCSNQGFKRSMCRHCEHEAILCTYGVKYYNATIVEDACNGDSGGIYFVLMRIIDFAGGVRYSKGHVCNIILLFFRPTILE